MHSDIEYVSNQADRISSTATSGDCKEVEEYRYSALPPFDSTLALSLKIIEAIQEKI